MNIFEKELHKSCEIGYLEGMEYYRRRIFRKLVESIYKGDSEERIDTLIEAGEFDVITVQKAYKYVEEYEYPISHISGIQMGKYIDWRVRSEIVIPTDGMTKPVYLRLTSEAASNSLTNYVNNLVEMYIEDNHLKQSLNYQNIHLKDRLKESDELLKKLKQLINTITLGKKKTQ